MIKTCAICGKVFTAGADTQMCCSKECVRKYFSRLYDKPDKTDKPRKAKTPRVKPESFTKICVICGKEFVTKRQAVITCSTECSRQNRNKRAAASHRKKRNFFDKTCVSCGKSFSTSYPQQVACSLECRLKHEQAWHRNRYKLKGVSS